MLEGNNNGAEQRNCADYEHISMFLLRLEEKFDVMMHTMKAEFERKIVKLESAVNELSACMKSKAEHNAHDSRQRCLKLQFSEKISSSVRTGDEIKGEGGNYLELALKDETGKLVDSGPESSARVHIFAFKGDIDENEGDSGENGYLVDHTARERKTKKSSILLGDVHLKLNKGSGILTNIKFRSSSSHMSGLFQIGARVVDHFGGVAVQDAKTDSFKVKDYRGKYNEKHRPPCLSDEIWRLDNIGKVGPIHDRLKEQDLNTVEDFLIQRLKDSASLKKLVDLPPKKWEATEKHALTCQLDEKVYCINSEENERVVFNAVGKVLGVIVESKYLPLDKLPHEAKVSATKLDVAAFVHKSGLIPFANEASLLQQFPGPVIASHPSNCTWSENTIDHEDEASEIGDSHQTNLETSLQDDPLCSPIVIECLDQQLLDSLLDFSFSDMLNGSPIVSNNEIKKKLFFLFTVTKWSLHSEKFAAYDGNDNRKRRRIS